MISKPISRRTLLKGLGVSIALPTLEAMSPTLMFANTPAASPPVRMAFVYVPNGINMADWTPRTLGPNFALPRILEPLRPFQQDLLVMSGLTCDKARSHGDGGGDHARAMSAFLTGCQPRKTHGSDIQVGISVDQVAAQQMGQATRFPSLEIGCEGGGQSGNCDSGYSCAYSSNLSWRSPNTPNPKEVNPRSVFDRLFAGQNPTETAQARANRDSYNLSILDFVQEDANNLMNRLGANDRQRMDEYLTSLREIEQRIAREDSEEGMGQITLTRPTGVPGDYRAHIRLMADLLVLAFQGDVTRIGTFVYANEGSNRSYRLINVPEGHHSLSHHQGNRTKLDKISQINTFHTTQFAYLLDRLKSIREGEGTLLDNCMIVYGSGNSDGNRHNHDELPILLAGRAGGTIATGRHVRYPRETPLTNLYLSMLDRMGVEAERLGDSTGRLPYLT